jgi:hypothetical protein
MTEKAENLLITTLAKGSVAELNNLIAKCDDRRTVREIYDMLMDLAHKASRKHKFSLTQTENAVKSK